MNEHEFHDLKSQVDQETAANKAEHEMFKRRIKELEEVGKERTEMLLAIQRQGDAIERIGEKVGEIAVSVSKVEQRVDDIEQEPAEKYKKITFEIVLCAVLAVVGALIGYFIK